MFCILAPHKTLSSESKNIEMVIRKDLHKSIMSIG